MADKILGFDSAKEEAKRIGRDNMMISAPLVFELCKEIENLQAQVNALEEIMMECTTHGELDCSLFNSYMDHAIKNVEPNKQIKALENNLRFLGNRIKELHNCQP
jgi:hypothetical protein